MSVQVYAVIENNTVVNLIAADKDFVSSDNHPEYRTFALAKDNVQIGWTYSNGKFLPPPRDLEKEWEEIRNQRNKLLADCDYVVLPDYWATLSETQKKEWLSYRKQLRDITTTFSDPNEVVFPEKP